MIVLERSIGRVVRYRRVYLSSRVQLNDLVASLRPLDLLRAFCPEEVVSDVIPPVFHIQRMTTFVDLSRGQDAICAGMHTNCRYKVRRAAKLQSCFEIIMNTEQARADFLTLYNSFAQRKGRLRKLVPARFNEYMPHTDVFMLYFRGRPTCGRLVLRDEQSGTALMLYSATSRLEEDAETATIGLLNRYLHWHEMTSYQAAGMKRYDFGGVDNSYPSVNRFKLSFGGDTRTFNYCAYAGSARIFWRMAHSLNQLRYDWRLTLKHLAT
jgi:hypothetical protein